MRRRELVVRALLVAMLFVPAACKRERDGSAEKAKAKKDPAVVSRTKAGQPLIRMPDDSQRRVGLVVSTVPVAQFRPQLTAYGRLEEDPSQTFVLRAPIAGVLQSGVGGWPAVGQEVRPGQVLGTVFPRLAPAERITLTTQLTATRSDAAVAAASVESARAAYARAQILNADNKNISDRALEDARVRLETEKAKLAGAQQTVTTLERSLQGLNLAGSVPLTADAGGVVTELTARPGESVEAGLSLMRVSALTQLIAKIDLPVGRSLPASATVARIAPSGMEDRSFLADRAGVSAVTDASSSPGESFRFRLRRGSFGLRPGMAVTAWIDVPGEVQAAYVVPAAAVVRLSGKSYVYVQTGDDEFVRMEIAVLGPADKGYFVSGKLGSPARVVTTGAQTLLSEEFRPDSVDEE